MEQEKRSRARHVDLLVNAASLATFQLRSQVLRELRRQLEQRRFVEVETPTLWPDIGGAAARPFETRAHALDMTMRMRISPELFLKVGRRRGWGARGGRPLPNE